MSVDDRDDEFESGFNRSLYAEGDMDFGVPLIPEAVWLAQMATSSLAGHSDGLLYRLMWGDYEEGGNVRLAGELWLEPQQMDVLTAHYLDMAANPPRREEDT